MPMGMAAFGHYFHMACMLNHSSDFADFNYDIKPNVALAYVFPFRYLPESCAIDATIQLGVVALGHRSTVITEKHAPCRVVTRHLHSGACVRSRPALGIRPSSKSFVPAAALDLPRIV